MLDILPVLENKTLEKLLAPNFTAIQFTRYRTLVRTRLVFINIPVVHRLDQKQPESFEPSIFYILCTSRPSKYTVSTLTLTRF